VVGASKLLCLRLDSKDFFVRAKRGEKVPATVGGEIPASRANKKFPNAQFWGIFYLINF